MKTDNGDMKKVTYSSNFLSALLSSGLPQMFFPTTQNMTNLALQGHHDPYQNVSARRSVISNSTWPLPLSWSWQCCLATSIWPVKVSHTVSWQHIFTAKAASNTYMHLCILEIICLIEQPSELEGGRGALWAGYHCLQSWPDPPAWTRS